ncbi:MAG TPA: hypothetical protein VF666_20290 [Pyrinomonadaceae bacterium]
MRRDKNLKGRGCRLVKRAVLTPSIAVRHSSVARAPEDLTRATGWLRVR